MLYASLVKSLGDFALAEDVLQEAIVVALECWPSQGVPAAPGPWLLTTAKRKAIDKIRQQKQQASKHHLIALDNALLNAPVTAEVDMLSDQIDDQRLALMFTCCHPALAESARVALTLRTLGGLQTRDIARAFLVPEKTMQQRLVRAKTKIKKSHIPFRVPESDQWSERLDSVLAVIYLIFNEGYKASESESLVNGDLCDEAIFLGRMLLTLIADSPAVAGLLALMLLHDARRAARFDDQGRYITLEDQDRQLWCTEKIQEGLRLLAHSFSASPVSPYQIQAAISALHVQADSFAHTDWPQICSLYNQLYRLQPSPVVKLNAIVAYSYEKNAGEALQMLDELEREDALKHYQPFYAAKADLLRRDGQLQAAAACYETAIALTCNQAESGFLKTRLDSIR
ncbi:MAG TPA: RNA polymerase subunit sigma-24 [Gammaproteobacteria bacterium]|jgi:RNA polymerase sigma-70 factor (ECF subfamily)|nr:RNA polymerase subunit sigma-24 [Gammaproteobacteria bacterium]